MGIIEGLKAEIEDLKVKIALIQNECSHPESCVTSEYIGDSGNYSRSDDWSGTRNFCGLCQKQWDVIN